MIADWPPGLTSGSTRVNSSERPLTPKSQIQIGKQAWVGEEKLYSRELSSQRTVQAHSSGKAFHTSWVRGTPGAF